MTNDDHEKRIHALEQELASLKRAPMGVRKRSSRHFLTLPLYDIALGGNPEKNELRGRARGIIAIGDVATGVISVGGAAVGLIAIGGLAIGAVSIGGGAIGILLALGGVAIGAVAVGGGAIGWVAIGGLAIGVYAVGGSAFGRYVINGMEQNPEAIRFFSQWIPGIDQLINRRRQL